MVFIILQKYLQLGRKMKIKITKINEQYLNYLMCMKTIGLEKIKLKYFKRFFPALNSIQVRS